MSENVPNVIALFAHPDDEIFVFPWIRAARDTGERVVCLWLTDGGWGGQDVERRCAESRRVLSPMGVAPDDFLFAGIELGVGDGQLRSRIDLAIDWLAHQFPDIDSRARLWIPAWEGGHPDHDAAHLVGQALARRASVVPRQFSLYHGKGLPGSWFKVLTPIPENGPEERIAVGLAERAKCIARCFAYRSQWKSFLGLLPFYALRMLKRHPFVLQPARWQRTAERPHGGALLYERRGGPTWEDFAEQTAAYRAAAQPG